MSSASKLLKCLAVVFLMSSCATSEKYKYESVPGDPMKSRIYTLDNGLKVYLTVNKETPRIQTYIAVRVGGKNDPAETTGLAHYFEHLMFKGTEQFGTQNYEQEKPMLDEIERLFEVYRKTTDEAERAAIYHLIDSVSYEASKIAIPNEYDKLMASIGANGTNAYTGFDQTVYVEDIPSNEVDNWAKIQADRFKHNVIRGFHTELEAVYEEKNMSLTNDSRKVFEALLQASFPDYPYGTQTVLGTQENLKNPSITNIKNYYKNWYVPNNMAICMSGDLNPDEVMDTITKYFGDMQPNENLKRLEVPTTSPITAPSTIEILGPEAESVTLGWRVGKNDVKDRDMIGFIGYIMNNGKAGIMDMDLLKSQKILSGFAGNYGLADMDAFIMQGRPKQGQTLDDVKELLIGEVAKLKNGEFDEALLSGTINNFKRNWMQQLEDNQYRADAFVESFIEGTPWQESVESIDRISKYTKEDVVEFANKYFDDNFATIYKRQGKDPNEKKISKPQITPIFMNRDTASQFLKDMQLADVKPIEPVFLDFNKDIDKLTAQSGIPVLYKKNDTNDLFQLIYLFDMGSQNDKALSTAAQYLGYLGTSTKSLNDINNEFYQMACGFSVSPGLDRTYVTLYGLGENMPQAIKLFEEILADAQVDSTAYQNLAVDILKNRGNAKLNQGSNFNQLRIYATWGENSPAKNMLSEQELVEMNPQTLVDKIHDLNNYEHTILYYGPASQKELLATLKEEHKVPAELKAIPEPEKKFAFQPTVENKVLIAPYDAKQIYYSAISNREEKFDKELSPKVNLYNEYFGGGMNAIVFQEMRESRGLAYSAGADLIEPSRLEYPYIYRTFIATQNDKMIDALNAFDEIINNMPESEKAFKLAKESMISRLRTERITKSDVIWAYLNAQRLGLSEDSRKTLFEEVQKLTLDDIKQFQEEWVKGRKYTHCILGDEKELDMKSLEKYGPIIRLTQEDIFGY